MKFHWLFDQLGVDRAISITLITRFLNVIAGLGLIYFVSHYLSLEMQGYYYTFYSLIALQVFAELGLNYAVIQFASHEMVALEWNENGHLIGDENAKKRLHSLLKFSFNWFGTAGLALVFLLGPFGIYFFSKTASPEILFQTQLAWVLLLIFTALIFFVNAGLALIEGCNKVIDVAIIRFIQVLISTVTICYALATNMQLYSLAIGSAASFFVGCVLLFSKFRKLLVDLWRYDEPLKGMNWKEEIWPFQWRIGVSWISGYLVFQIFNPILFASRGPVEAGKMGMSLQIISAINGLFIVWLTTKAPIFGQLIAKKDRRSLDDLFNRSLMQSLAALIFSILLLLFCIYYLSINSPIYLSRVIPLNYWMILSVACISNHILFSEAVYLRAHKEEPLIWLSIWNGLTTLVLALVLIPTLGTLGAVLSFSISAIIFGLFGGTIIFLTKRNSYYFR